MVIGIYYIRYQYRSVRRCCLQRIGSSIVANGFLVILSVAPLKLAMFPIQNTFLYGE